MPNSLELNVSPALLHTFANHPFHVRKDMEMNELVDSIRESGVIVPLIVPSRPEGGYEIISGHRRCEACRAVDAAQEKIHRTAQVLGGVVAAAQARLQQAMQRQQIDGGLHVVAVRSHGLGQARGVISAVIGPEAVGLVVQHVPAAFVLVGEVDQAGHQALKARARAEGAAMAQQAVPMLEMMQFPGRDKVLEAVRSSIVPPQPETPDAGPNANTDPLLKAQAEKNRVITANAR